MKWFFKAFTRIVLIVISLSSCTTAFSAFASQDFQNIKEICKEKEGTLLSTKDGDIKVKDKEGITPLMWASACGNLQAVELLVARGADINDKTALGQTALMLAAMDSNVEIAAKLLKSGADVNTTDNRGCTAIYYVGRIKEAYPIKWSSFDLSVMKSFAALLFENGLKTNRPSILTSPYLSVLKSSLIEELDKCSIGGMHAYVIKEPRYSLMVITYNYERTPYFTSHDVVSLEPYLNRGKPSDVWFLYCNESGSSTVSFGHIQLH